VISALKKRGHSSGSTLRVRGHHSVGPLSRSGRYHTRKGGESGIGNVARIFTVVGVGRTDTRD
jgi:hypothetical protein